MNIFRQMRNHHKISRKMLETDAAIKLACSQWSELKKKGRSTTKLGKLIAKLRDERDRLEQAYLQPVIEAAKKGTVIYYRRRDGDGKWKIKQGSKNFNWHGLEYEYLLEFEGIVTRLMSSGTALNKEAAKYIEYLENQLDILMQEENNEYL